MAKIRTLFVIFILGLLLIACKPAEEPAETDDTTAPGPDIEIYEQVQNKADETPAKETMPEMSDKLQKLLAKADDVQSLEYSYSEFVLGKAEYYAHVYVYGNKAKHELPTSYSKDYAPGTKYDVAYFDLAAKTVAAYCEDPEDCDDTETPISAEYDAFVTETPFSILDSIEYAEIVGSEMWDKKECTTIELTNAQGKKQIIWLWEYRGLPVRYEIHDSDDNKLKEVEFKSLIANGLKESDVTK